MGDTGYNLRCSQRFFCIYFLYIWKNICDVLVGPWNMYKNSLYFTIKKYRNKRQRADFTGHSLCNPTKLVWNNKNCPNKVNCNLNIILDIRNTSLNNIWIKKGIKIRTTYSVNKSEYFLPKTLGTNESCPTRQFCRL